MRTLSLKVAFVAKSATMSAFTEPVAPKVTFIANPGVVTS